jgi:hypothetical protein
LQNQTKIFDYGHWDIREVGLFNPEDFFGFIYIITNNRTGKAYIGKKQFKFKKRRQVKKRSKIFFVDSDWLTYCSSCEPLKEDISLLGKDIFSYKIIRLCCGRSDLTYSEEQVQYQYDVLKAKLDDGTPAFYNRTIAHKRFAGVEKQSEESKQKISIALKAYRAINPQVISEETKNKISTTLKEHPEYQQPMIQAIRDLSLEERIAKAKHANSFQSKEGKISGGRAAGSKLFQDSKGIFGMTEEKKKTAQQNGGLVVGKLSWWNKDGINKRSNVCPGPDWSKGRYYTPEAKAARAEKISVSMKAKKNE